MSKFSLAEIRRDHHRTLVNHASGRARPADYLVLYAPGAATAVALAAASTSGADAVKFGSSQIAGLMTAAGLLSAFFFGLCVTLLDKAIDFDESRPAQTEQASAKAARMGELAANSAFAAVVAGATTLLLVVAAVIPDTTDVTAAAAVGGVVTIFVNGALVLRRVYNESKDRLANVRSGNSQHNV